CRSSAHPPRRQSNPGGSICHQIVSARCNRQCWSRNQPRSSVHAASSTNPARDWRYDSISAVVLGTFSPWPLSLVDRADSLLLNVGEQLGSNLNAIRELRPSYCRYVHW